MNKRYIDILIRLKDSQTPLQIKQIAKEFGVSYRTIWYDLEHISVHMAKLQLSSFVHTNSGITLAPDAEMSTTLSRLIQSIQNDNRCYSADVRPYMIIAGVLQGKKMDMEQLCSYYQLSKSTILNDVRSIRSILSKYKNVSVVSGKQGIDIECDQILKRQILANAWMNLISHNDFFSLVIDNMPQTQHVIEQYCSKALISMLPYAYRCVCKLKNDLQLECSDSWTQALSYHIAMCTQGKEGQHKIVFSQDQKSEIISTYSYPLIIECFSTLNSQGIVNIAYDEQVFLSLLIQCAGCKHIDYYKKENQLKIQVCASDMFNKICNEFEEIFHNECFERLCEHLSHTYYRLRFGILDVDNDDSSRIPQNENLVVAVRKNCQMFTQLVGCEIGEDEIYSIASILSPVFNGAKKKSISKCRAIILTQYGPIVSAYLENLLCETFENISIRHVVSRSQFENFHTLPKADFIISTFPISGTVIPHVVISTSPEKSELQSIQRLISIAGAEDSRLNIEEHELLYDIFRALHQRFGDASYHQLCTYLSAELGCNIKKYFDKRGEIMLKDLLKPEAISLGRHANTWQEAVAMGGEMLSKNDCVEDRYINGMINFIETNGPYIVIAPGIAMPHARPEDGVKKVAASLVTLDSPVSFGHQLNDPVNIVICLAAVDNSSHLKALSELMQILDDDQKKERILSAKDPSEIVQIFDCQ